MKNYVNIIEGTNDITVEKIKKYYEVGVYDEYGMNSDPRGAYNVVNGKWIDICRETQVAPHPIPLFEVIVCSYCMQLL